MIWRREGGGRWRDREGGGEGTYQVMTCPELVPTARKERKGNIIVTQKQ